MIDTTRRLTLAVAVLGLVAGAGGAAEAGVVLTFAGDPGPLDPGAPVVEQGFSYGVFSGSLFRNDVGDPLPDLEGRALDGGGVATVARADLPGGLFTFDRVDIAEFGFGITTIGFSGYRDGLLVGSDSFQTTVGEYRFTTVASRALAGIAIDELRIALTSAFDSSPGKAEAIDNLVLTPLETAAVPEPSSLATCGVGVLLALGYARRIRRPA